MRIFIIAFASLALVSCRKEVSTPNNQIVSSTFDSIVEDWKFSHIYKLVSTQANPDVIIDSLFDDYYVPFSYFRIKADSTYRWYLTSRQSAPTLGLGYLGKWNFNDSARTIHMLLEKQTSDDFGPNTTEITPPDNFTYRIKYLSDNKMVLFFRVIGPDSKYWWWHDVFIK